MDTDLSAWTGLTTLTITSDAATPGMLYTKNHAGPGLAIGSTKPNVKTDSFSFVMAGTYYFKAAVPAGTALSGADVPEDKYGAWALEIGTNGTIDIIEATDNATGYDSSALAIAGLPAVQASHVRIGTVTAMKSDGAFDPGTTDLDAANTTIAYADIANAVCNYGFLRFRTGTNYGILGTNAAAKGRLLANSDGTWGNTGTLTFENKLIVQLDGTSRIMATYLDIALYDTEPTNKFVRVYRDKYTVSSINTGTNVITMGASHGWSANEPVAVRSSGTLPTPLTADTIYYVGSPSGADLKLLYQSSGTEVDLTGSGTGTIEIYSGYSGSTYTGIGAAPDSINILEDITADTPWLSFADGTSNAVLVDAGPVDYDQQRVYVTAVPSASTIQISADMDSAQYPLARIYLMSRNVAIRFTGNTEVDIIDAATNGVFQCEIRSTQGTGTTFNGYGLYDSNNNTVSGTISGCTYGLYGSDNNTVSGTISGCTYGLYYSNNNTVTGTISGCSYGLYGSDNNTVSGTISGCSYGLYNGSDNNTVSGTISGCSYGLYYYSNNNTVTGTISGCTYGLYDSNNNTVSGTISGCSYESRSLGFCSNVFQSANTSEYIILYGLNTVNTVNRVKCENLARVAGAHKIFDNYGNLTKTACDGTGDAPSVDPDGGSGDCVAASEIQSNCTDANNKLTIVEGQKIWLTAAAHTLTYKVQTTYAGITAGNLKLTVKYIGTDGALTDITNAPAIAQRSDDTDWTQTLAVTFTPTQEGWVTVQVDLMEYESGNEVYVWPIPTGTGYTTPTVRWMDGGPGLIYDAGGGSSGGGAWVF
jgi:hypothetical protein